MRIAMMLVAVTLAGCASEPADAPEDIEQAASEAFEPVSWQFDGEFVAAGVDGPIRYTFVVPENATEVEGLLTWTIPGGALDFIFIDPSGAENGDGWAESTNRRYVTNTYPVVAGEWTVEVTAQQGVDIHFTMQVEAREAKPYGPIEDTITIPPGNALRGTPGSAAWTTVMGRDFGEVNLNMVPGDWFNFTWTSTAPVYYNVHFHNEGTTDRPIEYTGTEMAGNFTAPNNEVYSMLWRNEGTEDVSVTYSLEGQYRLHSISRD